MGIGHRRFEGAASFRVRPVAAVSIEIVTDETAWAAVRPAWEELLAETPNPSPYWTWNYLAAWRAHFGQTCPQSGRAFDLYATVVRLEGRIVGIFPLFVERGRLLSLTARRLRFLGFNGGTGPADMTEEPIYLTRPGFEEAALDGLGQAVDTLRSQRVFDLVDLRLWTRSGKIPSTRFSYRLKKGPAVVELPDTWAEYRKRLTKSMRDNLGYYPRLLARHGHQAEVRIVDDPREIQAAVETLVRLHRFRNEASGDARRVDHFPTQIQAEFQASALKTLAESENGFVALLEVDGCPVAAQAFLRFGQTLMLGYSGFDPAFSSYSPLLILQSEVFQRGLASGVRRLDFQQGDRMWQTRWQAQPEGQVLGITVARKTPLSLARCGIYFVVRELSSGATARRVTRFWQRLTTRPFVIFGLDFARLNQHCAGHFIRLAHLAAHPATGHLTRLHLSR